MCSGKRSGSRNTEGEGGAEGTKTKCVWKCFKVFCYFACWLRNESKNKNKSNPFSIKRGVFKTMHNK